jgi:predicted transglutaminase-like cysteine proteinase
MRNLLLTVALAGLAMASPAPAAGLQPGLFQSLEVPSNPAREIAQWQRFSRKYRDEAAVYALCGGEGSLCSPALRQWRQTLAGLRGRSPADMLKGVNSTVNALVRYRADGWQPGRDDEWASPLESIENGGDCEDIAILKYVSLMELGFAEKQLRLVVVRDKATGRGHAVLAVKLQSGRYILDSLDSAVRPERKVTSYQPLYSISGKRRWLHLAWRKLSQL